MNDVPEEPRASHAVAGRHFDGVLARFSATNGIDALANSSPVKAALAEGQAPITIEGPLAEGKSAEPDVFGEKQLVLPDLAALVADTERLLLHVDQDQAALTERYIEAGRGLWALSDAHHENERRAAGIKRVRHETFDQYLAQAFPHRKRSTLREYMTLPRNLARQTRRSVGWTFQAWVGCGSLRNPEAEAAQEKSAQRQSASQR